MAVAGAFSLSQPCADGTGFLFEVAIREEERRVRCKLLYKVDEAAVETEAEGERWEPRRRRRRRSAERRRAGGRNRRVDSVDRCISDEDGCEEGKDGSLRED